MIEVVTPSSEKLTPRGLAKRLGICMRTLFRWIARGEVPKAPYRLDGKSVFWHLDDLPMEIRTLMLSAPSRTPQSTDVSAVHLTDENDQIELETLRMKLFPRIVDKTTPDRYPTKPPPPPPLPTVFPLRTSYETNVEIIRQALLMLGWREGPPPGAQRTAEVDQRIAAEHRCPHCHKKQMVGMPFHRPWRDYLLAAVCQACGEAVEL